ncbi:serine hydrolase [Mycolicibacterium komossense]|uniref:Serine hydrolase n=1 Tax=Mycolicibacterium komossense TaxID=1779 RepID=A0ABT3CE57_9MYCO|nr:serine hydrolase [Mycolicibacterium komossense]MCV7227658.1 serine hydrolase [Mycolicibacterium komossense]
MTAVARSLGVGLLVAALAACSSDKRPETTPAPPPTVNAEVPPPLVAAVPLPDHAVDNAVGRLDGIAEELMKSSGIPGMAIAVVHGGKTVYAKGFGVKDATKGSRAAQPENAVDPDTVFQLASLSKPLGATVVAHQVSQGAIGWDTPVVSKLPWFALSDPAVTQMVTVGDLYSHRSGLPDHAGDQLEDLGYSRRDVLERLRQLPLDPFRISYAYTNFGLTAAAEAVAAGAGKSWEDLSDQALYKPLGMASTSSRFADYEARPDKALGHIHIDGKYEPLYQRNADQEAPAGGVSSSVNDMAHWLTMVLGNGTYNGTTIADPKALLPAMSPQVVSSPASEPAMRSGFYGYGFNVGTTSAARMSMSHSGAFELGAGTNFVIIPSADVAIVVLTNATPSGIPETLTAEFSDLVQFGEVREDWRTLYGDAFAAMDKPVGSLVGQAPPVDPAPSAPLQTYTGTYDNDYWGPAKVTEKDGRLALSLGPNATVWPLTHWDGSTFTFSFVAENSPPGSISKATFDGDRLTLECYDTEHRGTFQR